jgi:hypothetical protein
MSIALVERALCRRASFSARRGGKRNSCARSAISRSSEFNDDFSVIIRSNGVRSASNVQARKTTRDVDHHARACWWSTSESSEKCPRVLRGRTSVPPESTFSFDLTGICAEFVVTLSHDFRCQEKRPTNRIVRQCFCFVVTEFVHDSPPYDNGADALAASYDFMSAVNTTILER